MTADSPVASVDRVVMRAVRSSCFRFNKRNPEVIVLVHEEDPKYLLTTPPLPSLLPPRPSLGARPMSMYVLCMCHPSGALINLEA